MITSIKKKRKYVAHTRLPRAIRPRTHDVTFAVIMNEHPLEVSCTPGEQGGRRAGGARGAAQGMFVYPAPKRATNTTPPRSRVVGT